MATITSENLANAIVKLVAVDALPALIGDLVMGNLVHREFEPEIAQPGDAVNVSTLDAPVVLTHAEATFRIPDVTKVLAVPDLLKLYMQPAVITLAERIETDLLSLATRFTANTPVGAAGTPLTEETLDTAETALFNAGAPASTPKYLVVRSDAYSALRRLTRFSEYSTAGEAGLRSLVEGPVGKLKDFYVFRSRCVWTTAGSNPASPLNLGFTKDAIGLVTRRLPQPLPGTGVIAEYAEMGSFGIRVRMDYAPNTLAQQFTIDALYGCAVLRNPFGIVVRS